MQFARSIRLCPAASQDLRMLIPRAAAREIVMRHARKLKTWERGSEYAMGVEVIVEPISDVHEMCLTDYFGFPCGLRVAFFEDTSIPPDGEVWIIGFRRENEPFSPQTIETFSHRKKMIERRNDFQTNDEWFSDNE